MNNLVLSVFNEKGNFANVIEIKENISQDYLTKLLYPHVVSENVSANAMSVRPMRGLTMNEQDFYRLILATLSNAGVVEDLSTLTTGHGDFILTAELVNDHNSEFPLGKLTIRKEGSDNVVLAIYVPELSPTETKKEYVDFAINALVSNQTSISSLLNTGTEYLVSKFSEMVEQEPERKEEAPVKQPRPQVREPAPVLERPVAELLPTKREVREKMKEALTNATDKQTRMLLSIPVYIEGRDVSDVIVELDSQNLERVRDEGVLTTICQELSCTIQDNQLYIPEANGFLLKIRTAFADHGIPTLSITPRGATYSPDASTANMPISIFEI